MRPRRTAPALLTTAALLCAGAATALVVAPARAATPSTVTVGVAGAAPASATYAGNPVAGNDDPLGPPAPVCSPSGCDRATVIVKAPAGFEAANVISLSVKLAVTDPTGQNTLDVAILNAQGGAVASNTGVADGAVVTASNLAPGTYQVEVDGDIALTPQSYSATVTAAANPKTPQQVVPDSGMTFSRETVASPFALGTEPNLAVDPDNKHIFTSPIFGSSTSTSFVLRSGDQGQTFNTLSNLIPGTSQGKVDQCEGGGDSDFASDDYTGDLYMLDLGTTAVPARVSHDYGQTFASNCEANSVNEGAAASGGIGSTVFPDRQWLSYDRKHKQVWDIYRDGLLSAGPGAVGGYDISKNLYGEYLKYAPVAAGPGQAGTNQVQFSSLCTQDGVAATCFGDVSIAGNAVSDNTPSSPHYGTTYLALTRSEAGGKHVGVVAIDPDKPAPHFSEYTIPGKNTAQLFPTVAVDRVGNVYVAWVDDVKYQIHVAMSSTGGQTWSTVQTINGAPAATTIMPWVVAGDAGRVAVGYYGSPSTDNPVTNYGPWNGYVAVSLDATAPVPHWGQTAFTDRTNHVDPICLSGLGCTVDTSPAGDRELGDFFKLALGPDGRIFISFADGANQLGESPTGTGPAPSFAHLVRQVGGPSLLAGTTITGDKPIDAVTVPKHVTPVPIQLPTGLAGPDNQALSLRGAALTYGADGKLHGTIQIAALSPVAATTPPALPVATYFLRWTYNKRIWWAGADITAAGVPRFGGGQAAPVNDGLANKYVQYPSSFTPAGELVTDNGVLRFTIDPASVGNPKVGDELFSVTAYAISHASPTPLVSTNTTDVPLIADSLPPFNTASKTGSLPAVLPPGVTPSVTKVATPGKRSSTTRKPTAASGSLAATGGTQRTPALVLAALGIGLALAGRRLRMRQAP